MNDGMGWPGCAVPRYAQLMRIYLTFHIVQVYIPALLDPGNQFTDNFSNGLDTCLRFDKRGLDRVQQRAAEMLARIETPGDAM